MTSKGHARPGRGAQQLDDIEDLLATALFASAGIISAISLIVLGGAQLAAITFGDGSLSAGLADSVEALVALPSNLSDPAAAWAPHVATRLPGPISYWVCTCVVSAVFASAAVFAVRWWLGRRGRSGAFDAGEGGLARPRDTRTLAVRHPTPGRLTLGLQGRQLLAAEPRASLAVVGPTGCGKTIGFAIPALLEWNGPIIATSVKTDLLDATLTHRAAAGKVWVYDPTSCSGLPAATWSPLCACSDWRGAMRVATWLCEAAQPKADTVSDGDYWYSQARKGLAPYLFAAATSGRTMSDVARWIDLQEEAEVQDALIDASGLEAQVALLRGTGRVEELEDELAAEVENAVMADARDRYRGGDGGRADKWLKQDLGSWPVEVQMQVAQEIDAALNRRVEEELKAEARPTRLADGPPNPALISAQALWGKESRLKGSVFATMENVLAGYADPGVGDAAASSEIDIDEWLSGDNTIFVIATAHEQARLRPVLSVLIQQAIRAAYDRANARGGSLEHPCLVLLDEAGNIAPLRDLPGYASTARSHGITFVSIWQDLAQIKSIYGERAQTVLNNHRAKLFGAGIADDPTLQYVSRLIGDERRTEVNRSGDLHGPRRSVSEHTSWRRYAPVDAIRRLRTGDGILVYGSLPPVWLRLRAARSGRPRPSSWANSE